MTQAGRSESGDWAPFCLDADVSELLPGKLYVSDYHATTQIQVIKRFNIHVIISLASGVRNMFEVNNALLEEFADVPDPVPEFAAGMDRKLRSRFMKARIARAQQETNRQLAETYSLSYHNFECEDSADQDIRQHFAPIYDLIENAPADVSVLVHCNQGRSRSIAVLVAYLMKKRSCSYLEAFDFVVKRRPHARPNPGFVGQLLELQDSMEEEDEVDDDDGEVAHEILDGLFLGSFESAKEDFLRAHDIHFVMNVTVELPNVYQVEEFVVDDESPVVSAHLDEATESLQKKRLAWYEERRVEAIRVQSEFQIEYCKIPLRDRLEEDLLGVLPRAVEIIGENLDGGKKILLHCVEGVSRSPSIVVAYVMKSRHLSLSEALKFVRERRARISPNGGFIFQLQDYANRIGVGL